MLRIDSVYKAAKETVKNLVRSVHHFNTEN